MNEAEKGADNRSSAMPMPPTVNATTKSRARALREPKPKYADCQRTRFAEVDDADACGNDGCPKKFDNSDPKPTCSF